MDHNGSFNSLPYDEELKKYRCFTEGIWPCMATGYVRITIQKGSSYKNLLFMVLVLNCLPGPIPLTASHLLLTFWANKFTLWYPSSVPCSIFELDVQPISLLIRLLLLPADSHLPLCGAAFSHFRWAPPLGPFYWGFTPGGGTPCRFGAATGKAWADKHMHSNI